MSAIDEGNRALAAGDFEEAVRCFKRAAYQAPGSPEPRLLIGHVYLQLGNSGEAIAEFEAAGRIAPTSARPLMMAAMAAHQAGKNAQARDFLRGAIALEPERVEPRYQLATALAEAGEVTEAIREYQGLLQKDPECLPALSNLGCLLILQGDPEGAIACFERVLTLSPGELVATYNLARERAHRGDFTQAGQYLLQVIERTPEFGEAYALLGWISLSQGLFTEAERAYRAAIGKGYDLPEVRMGQALAMRKLGWNEAYVEALKATLEVFPGYLPAERLLASL
ncbi:tetratricopeptide repeat protein [compost metagenome]